MSKAFIINSFRGGLSDYEDKGLPGCFKFAKNLDIRKEADTLTCGQALEDEGLIASQSESLSVSPSASLSYSPSYSPSASPSTTASHSASPSPSASPSLSPSPTASSSPSPSPNVEFLCESTVLEIFVLT